MTYARLRSNDFKREKEKEKEKGPLDMENVLVTTKVLQNKRNLTPEARRVRTLIFVECWLITHSPANLNLTAKTKSTQRIPPHLKKLSLSSSHHHHHLLSLSFVSMAKPRASRRTLDSYTIKSINKTIKRKSPLSLLSLFSPLFDSFSLYSGGLRADAAIGAVKATVRS